MQATTDQNSYALVGSTIVKEPAWRGQKCLVAQARCDGNRLLSSLTTALWRRLEGELQPVELGAGDYLHQAGMAPRSVYFPTTAIVSLVSELRDGSSAEVAVVGPEGVVGVCAFMGGPFAHDTAVVQVAGRAWRMRVSTFVQQTWGSEELMRPVLRYGRALMTHISQTAACNRHHSLEQRLCRWLLAMLDRQQSPKVCVTQDRLAAMLGVRRETVTGAACKLERAGLICSWRGCVRVLDRAGLEACSCECHAAIRTAHDHWLEEGAVGQG